jgi:2-desacetyl-2-hydroxyethyl bacteriochlorophyllide A dehydrogenase
MKAAVIQAVGEISVETVDDPTPGPKDVIVEVAGCGICGTDLHILDGEFAPTLPIIPGHEFSGMVVAVGGDVDDVGVGARVAVDPSLHCHECYQCKRGRGNLCERWAAIGVTVPGGAAQYAKAPAANCWVVPDGLELSDASLVEPLSCAVRGYDVLRMNLADSVLIYGSGTMGLMMMELAKRAGATVVDVVDLNPERLETAKVLGSSNTAASADDILRPRGWDVVIDCTGVAAAIADGLRRVAKGGTFLQFGVSDYAARVEFEPYKVYNEEITITGSMAVLNSFDRAGDLLAIGALNPQVMISHRFALDDYAKAVEQFKAGVGRKIQITPNA